MATQAQIMAARATDIRARTTGGRAAIPAPPAVPAPILSPSIMYHAIPKKSVSNQDIPNQTEFSEKAQTTRAYTFILRETDGQPWSYSVERNGQTVFCTGELTMFMNPEELIKEWPARVAVHQTPNGAWVDSFGLGLPKWTMKGTTGWRARPFTAGFLSVDTGGLMDGYLAYHVFADLIETYYRVNRERALAAAKGAPRLGLLELIFRDHTDDDWWQIEPEAVPSKVRSKQHPLMIEYLFRFTGIRHLKDKPKLQIDETGTALVGDNARFKKIAQVFEKSVASLKAANEALAKAGALDPSAMARVDKLANCSINRANTDDQNSAIARAQAYASAKQAREEMADWESGQTPTSVQQAAIDAVNASSGDVMGSAPCGDAGAVAEAVSALKNDLQSAKDAGIEGMDPNAFVDMDWGAGGDALNIEEDSSLMDMIDDVIAWGEKMAADLNDTINKLKDKITTPFKKALAMTTRVRNLMQSVSFSLDASYLTMGLRQTLRGIRTQLRGFLCAVQSILAFPYNFVQGLRDSLQAMFDLFNVSGCASTFPSIKPLSWKPSMPLAVPKPLGG